MRTDKDLMHGRDWRGQELAGLWLSEKFDGCRGSWDGSAMWTRDGNQVQVPDLWRKTLPAFPLDGEIWAGRGRFEEARLATQYGRFTARCRFVVFDAPVAGTLVQRMAAVREQLKGCPVAAPVARTRCKTTAAGVSFARRLQDLGGEGAMAQDEAYGYHPGRTRHLLKLRNF